MNGTTICNNVLIDFNILIERHVGVFNVLKNIIDDDKYFNMNLLKYTDIDTLIYRLTTEKYDNVLDLICRNGVKTDIIYNDILDNYSEEVYSKSIYTSILKLIKACISTGSINITVMYKNDMELHFLNKLNLTVKTIKYREELNVYGYDSIYVYEYNDLLKFTHCIGKNIYIPSYAKFINSEYIDKDIINKILSIDLFEVNKPLG